MPRYFCCNHYLILLILKIKMNLIIISFDPSQLAATIVYSLFISVCLYILLCINERWNRKFQAYHLFYLAVHLLQVIALNSSLVAEGELYIDDGKSFEFRKGAYIHRRFVFSDGKLTSSSLVPNASGKTLFSSPCIIGRIIILGHSSGPKNALIEPLNQKAEIELGPLWLRSWKSTAVLTIRRPNVPVADDWTIKILQ